VRRASVEQVVGRAKVFSFESDWEGWGAEDRVANVCVPFLVLSTCFSLLTPGFFQVFK